MNLAKLLRENPRATIAAHYYTNGKSGGNGGYADYVEKLRELPTAYRYRVVEEDGRRAVVTYQLLYDDGQAFVRQALDDGYLCRYREVARQWDQVVTLGSFKEKPTPEVIPQEWGERAP